MEIESIEVTHLAWKMADLFEGVQLQKHNLEVSMLFIILILHRVSNITISGDIKKRLMSQLERW